MTLVEKIADAETKYHLLVTGQAARVVTDQNGESVTFTTANAARLAAYIADLKRQLGTGSPAPLVPFF